MFRTVPSRTQNMDGDQNSNIGKKAKDGTLP